MYFGVCLPSHNHLTVIVFCQVTAATSRMTVKSEAGVAASIALAKISVQLLSPHTLERIAQVSQHCCSGMLCISN